MSCHSFEFAQVEVNRSVDAGPVIVSIPHAGRFYPKEILDEARVDQNILERLEDSYCDVLASNVVAAGGTIVKAVHARAVADCNRAPWQMYSLDVTPDLAPYVKGSGPKERAGLGVIPTRISGGGLLWKRPINLQQWQSRLDMSYRPFHAAVTHELAIAQRNHGLAILIDLHSMPSINAGLPGFGQGLIIGDRFGKSSGRWLTQLAWDHGQKLNIGVGINRPYAGGHILEKYGAPELRQFALQLEFDRRIYLNGEGTPNPTAVENLSSWMADLVRGAADPINWPKIIGIAAE